MITCISACPQLLGETINTLRFSQKAKCIKNKPVINHDTKSKLILDLRENVIKLQQELSSLKCESREATVTEQNLFGGNSKEDVYYYLDMFCTE